MAKCGETTKTGAICGRNTIDDLAVCLAHAPAEVRALRGFTPEAGKLGGRPAKPRVVDVLRERIEEDAERVLRPFFDALDAASRGGDDPDHAIRLAAARDLLDRGYGKPRQGTDVEISGSLSLNVLDLAASLEAPADAEDAA
jgi:hypothetical protein